MPRQDLIDKDCDTDTAQGFATSMQKYGDLIGSELQHVVFSSWGGFNMLRFGCRTQ